MELGRSIIGAREAHKDRRKNHHSHAGKKKSSNRRLAGRIVPVAISSSLSKSSLNASLVASTIRGRFDSRINTYGAVDCEVTESD